MAEEQGPSSPKLAVQLRLVPPRQGWNWVRQGLNVTMAHPLGFAGLFALTLLGWMLLASLPYSLGLPLVLAASPIVWLAFMRATRRALGGLPVTPQVYAEVWRVPPPRRRALLQVCAAYMLCSVAVLLLVSLLGPSGKVFEGMTSTDPKVVEATLASPAVLTYFLTLLGLMTPVSLLFWHAPPLVHSVGLPPAKAVFFSWMACWHNRWAFALYGLAWGGVVIATSMALAIVSLLIGAPQFLSLVAMPLSMVLGAAFYASLYFTVADCFEARIAE